MYMVIWYVIHDVQESSGKIINLRPLGQALGCFCNARPYSKNINNINKKKPTNACNDVQETF